MEIDAAAWTLGRCGPDYLSPARAILRSLALLSQNTTGTPQGSLELKSHTKAAPKLSPALGLPRRSSALTSWHDPCRYASSAWLIRAPVTRCRTLRFLLLKSIPVRQCVPKGIQYQIRTLTLLGTQMKIQPDHYAHMKAAFAKFRASAVADHRKFIVSEGRAKDVEKRLRWDLSYHAGLTPYICDHVYPYANDDHVDTALRSIMRELFPL